MSGELRARHMEGERWKMEARLADPPSTLEGECWIRPDLAPEPDQLGTLRVDVGNSTLDVPIFAGGTSSADIEESLRIQLNNDVGYVPLAPLQDATYPELRVQQNSGTYGMHDAVEVNAIPDSVIDDWETGDLTFWEGETNKYNVVTSPVKKGTFAVQNVNDNDGNVFIGSASGKEDTPQVGIAHRWYQFTKDFGSTFFGHNGTDSKNTGYNVRLNNAGNNLEILRWDSGSPTVLGNNTNIGTINQQWFEVVCLHELNGDLTVHVFDSNGNERTSNGFTVNDSTHITDGVYDHQNVMLEDGRGSGEAWDDWRYTESP